MLVSIVFISNLCNVSITGAVGPAYKVIICMYTHTQPLAGRAHSLSHLGIVCIDKEVINWFLEKCFQVT